MKGFDVSAHIWFLACDADVFRFGKKVERFVAAFAADAALFHSAERNAEVAHQPAIYPHGASVNSFGDAMGTSEEAARRNVHEGLSKLRQVTAVP